MTMKALPSTRSLTWSITSSSSSRAHILRDVRAIGSLEPQPKERDMNVTEFYTQWLAALRSGEYQQGQGQLNCDNTYCCLGVACDIAVKEGMGRWQKGSGDYIKHYVDELMDSTHDFLDRSNSGVLTRGLAQFLGMGETGEFEIQRVDDESKCGHGEGESRDLEHWLTTLNDNGFTFSQIADIIEYFFAPKGVSLAKSL